MDSGSDRAKVQVKVAEPRTRVAQAFEALANHEDADNPLRPILDELLGRHEKFADAVVGFVRENVRKVTSADVAFIPGGATSDGAIAWAELGVANAERTANEAESRKAAKKGRGKICCSRRCRRRRRFWRKFRISLT